VCSSRRAAVAGGDVILFEVKAGFIPQDVKGSRDTRVVSDALRKKYVQDAKGRGVGVRQLANSAAPHS